MPSPRWKGDTANIHEQPGSPHYQASGIGARVTHVFGGPYAQLVLNAPTVGAIYGSSSSKVESVEIVPTGAGVDGPGLMTIIVADDFVAYEVEWTTLEKALARHPLFRAGGAKELTSADLDKIEEWKNATTSSERTRIYGTLSANAKFFSDKLRIGEEAYLLPAPVARKTTRSYTAPSSSACGLRGAPSVFPGLPAGYEWLSTGDRAVKQGIRGNWERVQEWTGAEKWDADLYTAA
jgi:hypothetical protein